MSTSPEAPPTTADAAEAYRRDGVVVVRDVLDAAQLQELADAVDENLAAPGPWASDYTPHDSTGRLSALT